ncbi:hypothetical protein F3Y22_tig00010533pilonHSYRG00064 [Hibiscus syriacus]|uniref:Uncharacterized protein n=1 Tax=Hibiscus syriacus TaxID=106335 RepID=A0A6A3C6Y4_HIBSY|nr:uncharacterized protein LOC120203964 [Hibiscus syriacus]KAE8724247.1 hypothetical protein F3Y22_tig00010533pilonHSYRG00064 [Hibiscus syriacus]
MALEEEEVDLILVPAGLIMMLGYHLFLLYRYLHRPHTTVIGFENHDKEAWVEGVLQADKDGSQQRFNSHWVEHLGCNFSMLGLLNPRFSHRSLARKFLEQHHPKRPNLWRYEAIQDDDQIHLPLNLLLPCILLLRSIGEEVRSRKLPHNHAKL